MVEIRGDSYLIAALSTAQLSLLFGKIPGVRRSVGSAPSWQVYPCRQRKIMIDYLDGILAATFVIFDESTA